MTREDAFQTLSVYTQSQSLIHHHLAVEAAMVAIGRYLTEKKGILVTEEEWRIASLLHDADYELTRKMPSQHTLLLEEKLKDQIPPAVLTAIKAHNYAYTQVAPHSYLDWALYTCDELTGIIADCALMLPERHISTLTPQFIMEKLSDPEFEKSVNREQIALCEQTLGIPLLTYIEIVLTAMQGIDEKLGLH